MSGGHLGEATAGTSFSAPPAGCGRAGLPTAVLSRYPSLTARAIDLAVHRYEPRYAVDVDLLIGERVLRVMATHFGLRAGERRVQAHRLIDALAEPADPNRHPPHAVLNLLGDSNEWRGRAGDGIRALYRCLGPSAMPRTFPSWMPCCRSTGFTHWGRRCCAMSVSIARRSRASPPTICRSSAIVVAAASDTAADIDALRPGDEGQRAWLAGRALPRREPGPPLFGERG